MLYAINNTSAMLKPFLPIRRGWLKCVTLIELVVSYLAGMSIAFAHDKVLFGVMTVGLVLFFIWPFTEIRLWFVGFMLRNIFGYYAVYSHNHWKFVPSFVLDVAVRREFHTLVIKLGGVEADQYPLGHRMATTELGSRKIRIGRVKEDSLAQLFIEDETGERYTGDTSEILALLLQCYHEEATLSELRRRPGKVTPR